MTMSYDPLAYEMPWRPNYEKNAVAGWMAASCAALAVEQVSTMPSEPFYWMTGICGVMAMARLPKAIKLHLLQKHLKGRDLEFISIAELQKYIKDTPEDMWLGSGFLWENRHAQRVFEILKRDWTSIVGKESTVKKVVRKIQGKKKELPIGQPLDSRGRAKRREVDAAAQAHRGAFADRWDHWLGQDPYVRHPDFTGHSPW